MIVTCNHCAVRFKFDDKRVKPSGVKVRCSNCQQVFRLYPTGSSLSSDANRSAAEAAGKADGGFFPGAASLAGAGAEIDLPEVGVGPSSNEADRDFVSQSDDLSKEGGIYRLDADFSEIEKMLADSPESGGNDRLDQATLEPDRPLTLDLSDLEIESEGDQTLDLDALSTHGRQADSSALDDIGLDAGGVEVETIDPSTHFAVDDAPDFTENAAEGRSLSAPWQTELEDKGSPGAPAAGELQEPDFTAAFDDLDDLDELDPAEIEALLDAEAPPEQPVTDDTENPSTDLDGWQTGKDPNDADADGVLAAPDFGEVLTTQDSRNVPVSEMAFERLMDNEEDLSIAGSDDLDLTQLEKMIAEEEDATDGVSLETDASEAPPPHPPPGRQAPDAIDAGWEERGGAGGDEIDLSTLDALLDEEFAADGAGKSVPSVGDATAEGRLDLEQTLDLQSATTEIDESPHSGGPGEEALDFADFDGSSAQGADASMENVVDAGEDFSRADDDDALDFSDIEKLLEEELDAEESPPEELPEDLELELDLDLAESASDAEWNTLAASSPPGEKVLTRETSSAQTPEAKGPEEGYELESIDKEFDGASVILDGADGLELETLANYEELETVAAEAIDRLGDKTAESDEMFAEEIEMAIRGEEEPLSEDPGEAAAAAITMMPASRKTVRTPLMVLLVLTIIGAGIYAAYTMLDWSQVRIPFISQFFKQTPPEGNDLYNIEPMNVQSRFLSNSTSGTLLVISGRARNAYDHPRSYIRIKGTLIDLEGNPLKEQTVFCGNSISDEDLASLDMTAIGKRLNRRAGSNRTNIKVPAGRSIPFMLVFSDLPANLGEYSVAPVGSVAAR